ncbi:MAG: hypothetical protein R2873_27385 [Caldilineaceae bacterium]
MLVFVAPDAGNADALEQALRDYLAWSSIDDQREELNLDAQQRKQVQTSLTRSDETIKARLMETYSWLIVPEQPDATGPVQFVAYRISGADSIYARASGANCVRVVLLITEWSPTMLHMELSKASSGVDSPMSSSNRCGTIFLATATCHDSTIRTCCSQLCAGVSASDAPSPTPTPSMAVVSTNI